MSRLRKLLFVIAVASLLPLSIASAQRAGQSVTVRTGVVTGMRSVDLNDKSAVGGALVGGAFGAAVTSSNKSSSRRSRNAMIGAVIGGAAAASSRRPGRLYTVMVNEGTSVQIATEQTEIRVDDCVYVEESGGLANIRRAPNAACEPASAPILAEPEMITEMQEEASECVAAKQELIDADTDEAIDRAIRKVKLLCYD